MINNMPILSINLMAIVKIFVILALSIYVIFSLVVIKQVKLMTETVEIGTEWLMKIVSYIHFLFAVAVLIFAIIIL